MDTGWPQGLLRPLLTQAGEATMSDEPKVGDLMRTWFSGRVDGMSRVLEVKPYRGAYPKFFWWQVRLSSESARSGSLWMAV